MRPPRSARQTQPHSDRWRRRARLTVATAAVSAALLTTGGMIIGPMASAAYPNVTATTTVNIRSGPGTTHRIVGVLRSGDRLKQAGTSSNGWTPVTFNGTKAWISSAYLRTVASGTASSAPSATTTSSTAPESASSASTSGTRPMRTTSALYIRASPSSTGPAVAVVSAGTTLYATGTTSNGYAQVVYQNRKRWASRAYLGVIKPGEVLPTTGLTKGRATVDLMIRTTSGSDFTSLGDIPAGTIVTLTGKRENGVVQIIWTNSLRWVNATYVAPLDAPAGPNPPALPPVIGIRYATVSLDIRTSSGADSVTIAEVPVGTALSITGVVENGRAQIIWQGAARWVTAQYLSSTRPGVPVPGGPTPPPTSPTPTVPPTNGSIPVPPGLRPYAANLYRVTKVQFPMITTIYGVRSDPLPDHPSGHALDLMMPRGASDNALGWQIAIWMRAHAAELHIQYIIFDQKIWNISRDKEGWRPMADRGGPTANHKDHVHITTVWD